MGRPTWTLSDLERLVHPGADPAPHVVLPEVHDLWLAIAGAHLHPTEDNRRLRLEAAGRASALSERLRPGRGVSVDALLRFAEAYADGQDDDDPLDPSGVAW